MGKLTTHVLDTAQGYPAANVGIALYFIQPDSAGSERQLVKQDTTNEDGRLNAPIAHNDTFKVGIYELVFQMGDYFRASSIELSEPLFVDEVIIRFGINQADQHYHVPLLVSPWSYSTYRGS